MCLRIPFEAGLVNEFEIYRWSSVRCWQRRSLEDQPLAVDIDQIAGRGIAATVLKRAAPERRSHSARNAAEPQAVAPR